MGHLARKQTFPSMIQSLGSNNVRDRRVRQAIKKEIIETNYGRKGKDGKWKKNYTIKFHHFLTDPP